MDILYSFLYYLYTLCWFLRFLILHKCKQKLTNVRSLVIITVMSENKSLLVLLITFHRIGYGSYYCQVEFYFVKLCCRFAPLLP